MGLLDALGWVGESLGKPGAAVRGALAGRPDQLLNLIPFSDTLGITNPEERTSGRDLLRQWGAIGDEDNLGNAIGGGALEMALDPLTYAGGWLGRKALSGLGDASSALRGARSNMAIAHGVDDAGKAAQIVGGNSAARSLAAELGGELGNIEGAVGSYFPGQSAGVVRKGMGPDVWRHELSHGLVDQARLGQGADLPLPFRAVGALRRGTIDSANQAIPGVRSALGYMADEALAHGVENRGLLNQLGGSAKFLFGNSPERAVYTGAMSELSPMVGRVYGAMPMASKIGAAGALGLGGYAGARSLNDYLNPGG